MTDTRPFEVKFISPSEVRMGSPYNYCSIQFIGQTNIKLENTWWQDKCAWSEDNKYLVLIQWDFENNEPSFHFVIYNTISGKKFISERIMGLVNHLSVSGNKIFYNKFLFTGKTENGELIGHSDNSYEFVHF